jgi:predicted helicase
MSTKLTDLEILLHDYRKESQSQREKGNYFEELIICYLENEPQYKNLFHKVQKFSDWAKANGRNSTDTGIDVVATTISGEVYAVQCKL